jgi:hypothetical protein
VPRYSVPRSMRTRGTAPFSAVSKIGRPHDRRLAIMELGEAGLGIGVDEGLPIDLANPFQRANREGVPGAAKPKTFAFELCLSLFSGNLSARLERFPITWNHVINKEPLRIKELDHAGIEKVEQLFLDMLQLPRRKSSLESRTRPKAVGKPVQPVVEYDFSSIIIELKSKLIFFFSAALRSLLL